MSNNAKTINPCKVITGKDTRWSYANVWEPKAINGGTPKYSVSLIIPKSDTVTVAKIKAAIEAAYYGIFYVLYRTNAITFDMNKIILMFGFGMVVHYAISLIQERFVFGKRIPQISVDES